MKYFFGMPSDDMVGDAERRIPAPEEEANE